MSTLPIESAVEPLVRTCTVCDRRALADHERQTCLDCLVAVRRSLAALPWLVRAGEHQVGVVPSVQVGEGRRGVDAPLPGGDLLALIAPGSAGAAQVRDIVAGRDAEHAQDEKPDDPPSVAAELASWEDDWRRLREEPAATRAPSVEASVAYLVARLGWAADHHEAFGDFGAAVESLATRLRAAVGLADATERGAPCLDCGAALQRRYGHSGREDDWTCVRCQHRVDWRRYLLALRQQVHLEQSRAYVADLRTLHAVVRHDHPHLRLGTLRVWVYRGLLSARGSRGGLGLHRLGDVLDLVEERSERRRDTPRDGRLAQ